MKNKAFMVMRILCLSKVVGKLYRVGALRKIRGYTPWQMRQIVRARCSEPASGYHGNVE